MNIYWWYFTFVQGVVYLGTMNSGCPLSPLLAKQMVNPWQTCVRLAAVLIGSNGLAKNQIGDDEIDRRRTAATTNPRNEGRRGGATGTNRREGPALFDGGVYRRRPRRRLRSAPSPSPLFPDKTRGLCRVWK